MTPADDAAPVRSLDKDALKAKYRAERDKRLRADGKTVDLLLECVLILLMSLAKSGA